MLVSEPAAPSSYLRPEKTYPPRPAARRHDPAPARPLAATDPLLHRPFFLAGIAVILTAGATWGAWLLWRIGFAGKFTAIPLHDVNAHGHAQIYGWVGLFMMGFAYQMFPRLWQVRLAALWLAPATLTALLFGMLIRTLGMTLAGSWELAVPAAMLGGTLEIAACAVFAVQIAATYRASAAKLEPYIGFVLLALGWLVTMSLLDVWHTWTTMTATSREELLWYIATWQAPLRDLQIHGLGLFMIFGVSMRMLPQLFGVATLPPRRAWRALWIFTAAVAGEVGIFLAYRFSGNHALAALLMAPWILLAVASAMVALPWKLWRPLPVAERSGKFIRAAYAWLAISLAMLLLLPVHQALSDIPFSHAYYGAIRHAITVGFISLMIMGMSARIVPALAGIDTRMLTALWGPFILINLGCFLRVSTQALTDFVPSAFAVVGVSGTLEVIALAWWGAHLAATMLRK